MSGYTAEQVDDALEASSDFDGYGEFRYGGDVAVTIDGDSVLVQHEAAYGGEGLGDEAWVVVKVGEQYFRMDGYYSSYDGFDWDGDLYEVTPQQKTITVWE